MIKRLPQISLLILIVFFIAINIASSFRESLTYDEIVDIQEGMNGWKHQTFTEPNNPPFIKELATLPLLFYNTNILSSQQAFPGRLVITIIAVFLLIGIYIFTKKIFGIHSGIFAVFLLVFDPDILANSHYITMEIGFTLFFFLSYIIYYYFLKKPTLRRSFFLSIVLGFGLSSKISMIPYFMGSCFLLSLVILRKRFFLVIWKKKIAFLFVGFLTLFIIWGTYFFRTDVIVKQRNDPQRVSSQLLQFAQKKNNTFLKKIIYFSEEQKVPLGQYIATIKNNVLKVHYTSPCFFLGTYYSTCRWYFLPVNFILKISLPLLFFICIGISYLYSLKQNREILLILSIPIIIIFIVAILSGITPLIRYILPVFPFFIIIASASIRMFIDKKYIYKLLFICLCIWYMAETLLSFPHYLSYANELAGQKDILYTKFTDSNIDWGQSLLDVASFHREYPDVTINLSYFGRDNGFFYGLKSVTPFGGYKAYQICSFHTIKGNKVKKTVTLISISNWYGCGYNKQGKYKKINIKGLYSDSFLVF